MHDDRLMLRRALGNLISNALSHTQEGGTICVAINQDEARTRLQAQNTGDPVAAAHLARFFSGFTAPIRRGRTKQATAPVWVFPLRRPSCGRVGVKARLDPATG